MLVCSDNNPQEFEFLQGGILVRWDVQTGKDKVDGHTTYNCQEVKIELTDTQDQVVFKLTSGGYTDSCNDFADKIIAFRDAK
jgi:hypothetical protein